MQTYIDESGTINIEQISKLMDSLSKKGHVANSIVLHPEFYKELKNYVPDSLYREWIKDELVTEKVERVGAFDIFKGLN